MAIECISCFEVFVSVWLGNWDKKKKKKKKKKENLEASPTSVDEWKTPDNEVVVEDVEQNLISLVELKPPSERTHSKSNG